MIIRCVICGKLLNKRRRKYCSDECRYHKRFERELNLNYEKCDVLYLYSTLIINNSSILKVKIR